MTDRRKTSLKQEEKAAILRSRMEGVHFVKFVGTGRTLWGVRRREDGVQAATLMTMLDAAGTNVRLAHQEDGDCPLECPTTLFEKLTPPEEWPEDAPGREEACSWYAAAEQVRRHARMVKEAPVFLFPDGISTSRGLVHVAVPLPGACSVNIPAGDSLAPDIGRNVGIVMTRRQADSRGAVPLSAWCRDVWDAVSGATVVLDYRDVGRGEPPVVHATCHGTFNGIPFRPETIGMEVQGTRIRGERHDDLVRDIVCTDVEPVYQSGMRGPLLCSQPVRIVEIACGVEDGELRVRGRYPRNEAGRFPWIDSYELMVQVLRERMREGTVAESVFMDDAAFVVERYGSRDDEEYARQMTQVPIDFGEVVAQARRERDGLDEEDWERDSRDQEVRERDACGRNDRGQDSREENARDAGMAAGPGMKAAAPQAATPEATGKEDEDEEKDEVPELR